MLPAETCWWLDTIGPHFNGFDEQLLGKLGFDKDVFDWSVSRLSTGEKQRLGLLRLLSNHPEALLLDEPTASLDRENTECVEQLLRDYSEFESACVIWVSHDTEQAARVASRHFQLKDGQLQRT